MARTAALTAALLMLAAAPAHAAFAPDFSVGVTPATAGGLPMLTATVSQPITDTPIQRFTLTLPPGFTAAGAPGAAVCDPAALSTNSCPVETLIGTYGGRLGPSVPLTGTIAKTGPDTFGLRVSIIGGAITQVVEGSLTRRANGALDLKLDELPALAITSLAFRFWGEERSLLRAPARCGEFTLDGKFTSRAGELAIERTQLPITGCAGVPSVQVANVRFSKRRFEAGGSAYAGRTIIAWWLSQPVSRTKLRIERRADGVWHKLGKLVGSGNAGDNALRWDGRLRGRELQPGRYAVRVQPAGSEPSKRTRFRILR